MREIEFRAYIKDLNKIFNVKEIDLIFKMIWFEEQNKPRDTMRMIDQCELMQYTGLKDKNGTKIFEGDIVEFNRHRKLPNHTVEPILVKFNNRNCAFELYPYGKNLTTGGGGRLLQLDMMSECEVIGNIYDNPELLEKVVEE